MTRKNSARKIGAPRAEKNVQKEENGYAGRHQPPCAAAAQTFARLGSISDHEIHR